jgi:RNA polymerase sigma-70 factor (ECF subfamily)
MSNPAANDVSNDMARLIPSLRKFARRFCKDSYNVDDLVQETLTRALAAKDSFQPGTRLRSWLLTIMRNTHYTNYVKEKRMVVSLDSIEAWQPQVGPTQEWALRAKDFEVAFASLSPDQKQMIDLVLLQGKSYEDAAKVSDCAVGTVKSRVNRARAQLALQMGEPLREAAYL